MPKNKKIGGAINEASKAQQEMAAAEREKALARVRRSREVYKRAKENKGSDRLTTKDVEAATERTKLLDARRPYIGAERRGDRLTNSVNKKGGGIASKGMGAAYKGGGMATRGMGKAYLSNQGSRKKK